MTENDETNSEKLLDENDTWSNCDDWEEDSDANCLCPFCELKFPSATECFSHTIETHNFDFHLIKKTLKLDFYSCMRLVNYVRQNSELKMDEVIASFDEWKDVQKYLTPALPDDALLYEAFDEDLESEYDKIGQFEAIPPSNLEDMVKQLQIKLASEKNCREQLQLNFEAYKKMVSSSFMSPEIKKVVEEIHTEADTVIEDKGNYYFESYAGNEIHESMLRDTVRTLGYRDFIYNNKSFFKDKIVMDVGCGTGILSLFAVKAGAKHVFAVDNSDIILKAREIAKENEVNDKITFIKGKVEQIKLPVEKVDIIISEWMGYFLLFEGMLDSVLSARDKWLAHDGIMAPSCTKIVLSAFGDPEWYNDTVNFWSDVYGLKMNTMASDYKSNALVTVVNGDKLISNSVVVSDIETKFVTVPKLDFEAAFELEISENGKIYAFCGWFDTYFEGKGIDSVMFSTSPMTKATHWMQTLFILEHPLVVNQKDKIVGKFHCKKSIKNPRELDVIIEYQIDGQDVLNKQHFNVV